MNQIMPTGAVGSVLVPDQVRLYIQDSAPTNYLLDNLEFTDARINFAMYLAISETNLAPPKTTYDIFNFPHVGLLLNGTLYKLFQGQAPFFARNTLPYSDGGVQVNLEERAEAYMSIAKSFQEIFLQQLQEMKLEYNLESGFAILPSDFSTFPIY